MSLARPVSVSVPVLSPVIVTAWPPPSVNVPCAPAPPMPRVPIGTERVTVTGKSNAPDSASATTKPPPM